MEVTKRLTTWHALVGKNNGGTKATFNEERKKKFRLSKGKPSLRPSSGFGNQVQTLLKDCLAGADNTPEQPNSSHYFLSHITHNHTRPTTACISISQPSQRCFFRRNLSVLLGIQCREPKWWEDFEGPLTLKLLSLCPHRKVAVIQGWVNRRSQALGFHPCLQEISLPEDKAPTNYIEKILCIDKSKDKGNTRETKLSKNMECWRGCIQIKRKKHFLLVFTFL